MQFHHRAVPIVLAIILIDSIGFGIVLPVLPRLIVELANVGLEDATRIGGWMMAVFAVTHFFAGPVIGMLGDAYGRRRVLLLCLIAFAADYALMAAAPTIAWLFVGRFIAGIAGATYGPANAVLADVTPPEKRAATFGLMGAAFGIGFIIGPAMGGLLALWGPRAPFVAAALCAAINAVWVFAALPETLTPEKRRRFDIRDAHIIGAFRPLLHAGNAKWLLLAVFLWQLAHMVYPTTWAFYAELALGWDEREIGWSLAVSGLVMALVQALLIGKVIARFGEERAVLIGIAAGTLVFAGYAFARETWAIYALLVAGGLQAFAYPSMNALLSRMTDPSHQGALQGGVASLASVAAIIAPLLLSQALAIGAERGFPAGNFVVAALLAFLALLIVGLRVVPNAAPRPVA